MINSAKQSFDVFIFIPIDICYQAPQTEVKRKCITEYDEVRTMNLFNEEGREEGNLSAIKKLMKNMKISAQQAMDLLEIAPKDQPNYLAML